MCVVWDTTFQQQTTDISPTTSQIGPTDNMFTVSLEVLHMDEATSHRLYMTIRKASVSVLSPYKSFTDHRKPVKVSPKAAFNSVTITTSSCKRFPKIESKHWLLVHYILLATLMYSDSYESYINSIMMSTHDYFKSPRKVCYCVSIVWYKSSMIVQVYNSRDLIISCSLVYKPLHS